MMQRPSDELLVAFLDGEVDESDFAEVTAWLDRDPSLRTRLSQLGETTALVREAFEEVLREPIPARLFEAVHPKATILQFRSKRGLAITARRWAGMAAAASLGCIMFGASLGYLAAGGGTVTPLVTTSQPVQTSWLDNLATYHDFLISSANGAENTIFDINKTATEARATPADITIPDLKPWSLTFEGGRKIVVEGKPAFQFIYFTDNKQLGPISLTVTNTTKGDSVPLLEQRDGVNILHWYHAGHGYVIIGQADKGYLWGLANDIEWQLKAI
jgi:anti-sigma factor RsiW